MQGHQLFQCCEIYASPGYLLHGQAVDVFEEEVFGDGRCSTQRASYIRCMIALAPFETRRNLQQQLACGMDRLWTRRCRWASEKDALQHLELWSIGFGDAGRIVTDSAGDGRHCAVTVS